MKKSKYLLIVASFAVTSFFIFSPVSKCYGNLELQHLELQHYENDQPSEKIKIVVGFPPFEDRNKDGYDTTVWYIGFKFPTLNENYYLIQHSYHEIMGNKYYELQKENSALYAIDLLQRIRDNLSYTPTQGESEYNSTESILFEKQGSMRCIKIYKYENNSRILLYGYPKTIVVAEKGFADMIGEAMCHLSSSYASYVAQPKKRISKWFKNMVATAANEDSVYIKFAFGNGYIAWNRNTIDCIKYFKKLTVTPKKFIKGQKFFTYTQGNTKYDYYFFYSDKTDDYYISYQSTNTVTNKKEWIGQYSYVTKKTIPQEWHIGDLSDLKKFIINDVAGLEYNYDVWKKEYYRLQKVYKFEPCIEESEE